eukprot:2838886-Amphidinium_carterae.1
MLSLCEFNIADSAQCPSEDQILVQGLVCDMNILQVISRIATDMSIVHLRRTIPFVKQLAWNEEMYAYTITCTGRKPLHFANFYGLGSPYRKRAAAT